MSSTCCMHLYGPRVRWCDARICWPASGTRWLGEALGKVENQITSPKDALKELAAEINQAIRTNLERRSDLRKTYEKRMGKPYEGMK